MFPDSSEDAYRFVQYASLPDTILYCDVRLTKDELGICLPDIKMDNCTDIADIYAQGQKTVLSYLIKYWMLFMPVAMSVLDEELGNASSPLNEKHT